MEPKTTVIEITEREGRVTIGCNTTELVNFELDYRPKTFAGPKIAELEAVIANQRTEIHKAQTETSIAKLALDNERKERNKAKRKKPHPAARRRR